MKGKGHIPACAHGVKAVIDAICRGGPDTGANNHSFCGVADSDLHWRPKICKDGLYNRGVHGALEGFGSKQDCHRARTRKTRRIEGITGFPDSRGVMRIASKNHSESREAVEIESAGNIWTLFLAALWNRSQGPSWRVTAVECERLNRGQCG